MKKHPDRNRQFEIIKNKKEEVGKTKNPQISIDTKKKEFIGNFYRKGRIYTKEAIEVYDHDFNSFANGIVIPHGIYDIKKNLGFVNIGTSRDTTEFACDSLRNWWKKYGKKKYKNCDYILMFCDGGGSNMSGSYLFKEDMQKLVNEIGKEIRVCHYPPYCSKYNPIEHRMFPHVTRACKGAVFESVELVSELISETKTDKGLKVEVDIIYKEYEKGRSYSEDFKDNMKIVFDDELPNWNYSIIPEVRK